MIAVTLALVLLALTCLSSALHRVIRLPLPILQILIGVVAALPPFRLHVAFDPHTFLLLFIPPLLFADGWRLPRRELRAMRWPLLGAAVGLVLATVAAGGYFLHWLIPSMPLSVAFAVAAVVSPTDAVAFGALTERITVPPRMQHMLESEALLNDASGLVALRFAVAATLTGSFSFAAAGFSFLLIALGGLAIGWLLTSAYGWLIRRVAPHTDDAPVAAILSALLPFAAYWVAEQADVSGILAAVAAGLTANRAGLFENAHFSTRLQSGSMWQVIVYSFNGVIFVLLGSQLPGIVGPTPGGLDLVASTAPLQVLGQVAALTALLISVRLVWMVMSIGIERLAGRLDHAPGLRVVLASALGGVRGAITLAGVLTLPLLGQGGTGFPSRDLAITLATGVILFSMVIAAVFLPLLLAHIRPEDEAHRAELRTARRAATQAAIAAMQTLPDGEERTALLQSYRERLDAFAPDGDIETERDTWRDLHAAALQAERTAVQRLRDTGDINDDVARELMQEIDLLEAASMRRPARLRSPSGAAGSAGQGPIASCETSG